MHIGKELKTLIAHSDFTQRSIAKAIDVHETLISQYLSKEKPPKEFISKVCEVLGIDPNQLTNPTENDSNSDDYKSKVDELLDDKSRLLKRIEELVDTNMKLQKDYYQLREENLELKKKK